MVGKKNLEVGAIFLYDRNDRIRSYEVRVSNLNNRSAMLDYRDLHGSNWVRDYKRVPRTLLRSKNHYFRVK